MVAIRHLVSPAALPHGGGGPHPPPQLTVLSYNVLLPNSVDGWWNYKMYLPPLEGDRTRIAEWDYRRDLLRDRIGLIDADVVCLQEISPISFEEDFAFMKSDLGYDGCELFRKGRFRPATFWKSDRVGHPVVPPVHRDRALLTTFRVANDDDGDGEGGEDGSDDSSPESSSRLQHQQQHWHVLNCHLQAGKEGARRVRQVHEGINAVFKLAKKLQEKDPKSPNLIMCGDFNGGEECGAVRFVEDGSVSPDFLEDGETVTSKVKSMPLSAPLRDVAVAEGLHRGPPPPTLVVSELISQMVEGGRRDTCYIDPRLSRAVLERLERIYDRFATHAVRGDDGTTKRQMNASDVERWLEIINGQVGRGSEFRTAAREMGWVDPPPPPPPENGDGPPKPKVRIVLPPDGVLTLEGFVRVYEAEFRGGKFWGIAYDLARLGEPLPDEGIFEARYDRMYFSSSLRPTAVLDTLSAAPCPNEKEPSDHLPVAATFQMVS